MLLRLLPCRDQAKTLSKGAANRHLVAWQGPISTQYSQRSAHGDVPQLVGWGFWQGGQRTGGARALWGWTRGLGDDPPVGWPHRGNRLALSQLSEISAAAARTRERRGDAAWRQNGLRRVGDGQDGRIPSGPTSDGSPPTAPGIRSPRSFLGMDHRVHRKRIWQGRTARNSLKPDQSCTFTQKSLK
jgi:hypothetical protein